MDKEGFLKRNKIFDITSKINFNKAKPNSLKFNRITNLFLGPILINKLSKIDVEYKSKIKNMELSTFKERIERYTKLSKVNFSIEFEDALSFLSTLVSINTTNSQNGEILLKFFEYYLKKNNLYPTKIIKTVSEGVVSKAYFWENNRDYPWVVINTHYDVIPSKGWVSAFDPKISIEEGKLFLYGRGSNDNKFGFLTFLLALKELRKLNINVCFTAVGDEEKGGERGTYVLLKKIKDYLKEKEVFGIVLEPTLGFPRSLKVGVRNRADLFLSLNSKEFKPTDNKGGGLIEFIYLLSKTSINSRKGKAEFNKDESLEMIGKDIYHTYTTMSIKSLEIFESIGTTPGRGKVHLFFRFFPEKDFSSIEDLIKSMAYRTGIEIEVNARKIDKKGFIDINTNLHSYFIRAINEVLKIYGLKGKAFRTIGGGGSDAKYFHNLSIPVVEFGINPYDIHSRNERADVMEIYVSALIMIKALSSYSAFSRT